MPWPYRVACDCELQPVVRQYVAAPYDGVFEKSLVKPGDVVERDQVLGRMDGREIRWQLAGIEADQSRAGKSRDVNMAATKTAAAQIDALEVQRLEQQRRLFEHRAAHLEIRSPIDGLVIAGDLQRSEGVPLTVGQTLYEVAPLGQMVAEVLVPDDDALHVTIGQEVRLRLDAQPSRELRGRIDRLTPRAEVRDDANVFVAEVVLVGDDPALRPGMKGRARISTEWHPLGWNWFHKPAGQLAAWLGW